MKSHKNVDIIVLEVIEMYSEYYGIYQTSRNASWQFLIDNNINKLPVSLGVVCKNLHYKILEDSKIHYLQANQRGISFCKDDIWYIVLQDKLNPPTQRYTLAHELGHIFLGHPLIDGKYGRTFASSPEEYQAERFAIDILAPACVLWGLNLHSAEDIAKVCNISMTSATKRARRMEELYRRNMFLSHPLERQVYQQFKKFIEENK